MPTLPQITKKIGAHLVYLDLLRESERDKIVKTLEQCLNISFFSWEVEIFPCSHKVTEDLYNDLKDSIDLRRKILEIVFEKNKPLEQLFNLFLYKKENTNEVSEKAWYYLAFYIYFLLVSQGDLDP